jgi:heme-degrading monooxygenase HmoA
MPADTPPPPYHAVIFTSLRAERPGDGYAEMAVRMEEMARTQPGFLGIESARDADGLGITISYWATEEAVRAWGRNAEHLLAQKFGRERWYERYTLRHCLVQHVRTFTRDPSGETT